MTGYLLYTAYLYSRRRTMMKQLKDDIKRLGEDISVVNFEKKIKKASDDPDWVDQVKTELGLPLKEDIFRLPFTNKSRNSSLLKSFEIFHLDYAFSDYSTSAAVQYELFDLKSIDEVRVAMKFGLFVLGAELTFIRRIAELFTNIGLSSDSYAKRNISEAEGYFPGISEFYDIAIFDFFKSLKRLLPGNTLILTQKDDGPDILKLNVKKSCSSTDLASFKKYIILLKKLSKQLT